MKFRQFILTSGTEIKLGKDAKSNDELMKSYEGKDNTIIHTFAPGSPFCVIDKLKPTAEEIVESGAYCAKYSQDWRDNKKNVKIDIFTGKNVKKDKKMELGTWGINKCKTKIIKKEDIQKVEELVNKTIKTN